MMNDLWLIFKLKPIMIKFNDNPNEDDEDLLDFLPPVIIHGVLNFMGSKIYGFNLDKQ